jgi:hypothetical protein
MTGAFFAPTGYFRLLGQYARASLVREMGDADQFLSIFGVGDSFSSKRRWRNARIAMVS